MTKDDVLKKLQFEVKLRGLSTSTQNGYYLDVRQFQDHYDKAATELTVKDIKNFLYYQLTVKGLAPSSVNKQNSSLRFLYNVALDMPIDLKKVPFHSKKRRFPEILTREEVNTLFEACDNLRDKALFMTIYSAGLRLAEASKLKVTDIDSQKMQLFICNGKGDRDRYAILSQACLDTLREYWKKYRPKYWLFYPLRDKGTDTHISSRTIQKAFDKHKNIAGITKKVSVHSLRHSFATHLLEDGVSIFHIKQLLGHLHLSTTCTYLHLVKISELNVASPLDAQPTEKDKTNA